MWKDAKVPLARCKMDQMMRKEEAKIKFEPTHLFGEAYLWPKITRPFDREVCVWAKRTEQLEVMVQESQTIAAGIAVTLLKLFLL